MKNFNSRLRHVAMACMLAGAGLPAVQAQNHGNISIMPMVSTVCYGTQLSAAISGNSFQVQSYQWSTGATTSTTQVFASGSVTLTVTGRTGSGNNGRPVTITRTVNYNVLPQPSISATLGPWVCKGDRVELEATPGYDGYVWSDGTQGSTFSRLMDNQISGPVLDTATISYTAILKNVCTAQSAPEVIRAIRKPTVGSLFCGNTSLSTSDSIRVGLVLTYLYQPSYEVEFTQVSDPTIVQNVITGSAKRWVSLSSLTPGENYYVRVRPIINGIAYCYGEACEIGIASANKVMGNAGMNIGPAVRYEVFTIDGRYMASPTASEFSTQWFRNSLPKGTYAVIEYTANGTGTRKVMSNYDF